MYIKILIIAQVFLGFHVTEQCQVITFRKNPVLVVEVTSSKYQIVTGCISPKRVIYNPTTLKEIKVIAQNLGDLNEGAVENIPEQFQLSFNMNNISTIKSDAFRNLDALETIYMDQNDIRTIETNAFDSLPSLDVINLENNKIELIMQHAFANLPNLTMLSLDDNKLKSFHQDWFHNTPRLQTLFINNNLISAIPKAAFVSFSALQYLSMVGNKIIHVHRDAFMGLDNLLELSLEENRLKEIAVDFTVTPNLRYIHLSNNALNYLPDKMLSALQHSLKGIWIFANPWQCPCLDSFIEWGGNYNIRIMWKCNNTDLSCVIPKHDVDKCIPRSNDEFYEEAMSSFTGDCIKRHKP
uniref:LRRCT domain-containing protein n=1 Tax=Photinus pyralis TaxID=7054 RepID=A0A1Y1KYB0_PHOPY